MDVQQVNDVLKIAINSCVMCLRHFAVTRKVSFFKQSFKGSLKSPPHTHPHPDEWQTPLTSEPNTFNRVDQSPEKPLQKHVWILPKSNGFVSK